MFDTFRSFCESIVKFNDEEWQALEKCLSIKSIAKNQHFLREGDVCQKLGFITEGYTRLYFLVQGEELTKDFCFENSFTGSTASFLSGKAAQFCVVAMEDTQLITLESKPTLELFAKYHCWSMFGLKMLGEFAIRKENREISFLLHSPEQRYIDLMDSHADILQRVPLKYIASYLGMTPETLSRIRNKISKS